MKHLRTWLPPLVYLLLAVAITWPVASAPGQLIPGAMRSDAWNSIWSLWFVSESLRVGELPLQTGLLDFPHGGRLVVADPVNALIGLPLVRAWGPVTAYSLLALLHSAFAGLAAHWLSRHQGGQGWVAGVGYQLAPVVLSHLHNGSSEAISAGWLPLAALALFHLVDKPDAKRALLAGGALALAAWSGWYAGVAAWCVFVGVLAFHSKHWRHLGLAAGLGLLLTLPWAHAVREVARAEDGLVNIKADDDLARLRRTLGPADPRTFFVPGDFRSPDFQTLEGRPGDYVHTSYLGYLLLILALVATWRREKSGPWWLAFALAFVLALGPVVVMDGFPASLRGRAIPLPYMALEGLPGFSALSLLYRITGLCVLALAVLADRALPPRLTRYSPLLALLVAGEATLISPARELPEVTEVPESPALRELATMEPGALINLPVTASRSYLYEQTLHHKPLTASLNTGANLAALQVLRAARFVRRAEKPPSYLLEMAQAHSVRYVVIHKDLLISATYISASTYFKTESTLVAEDSKVRVYALY